MAAAEIMRSFPTRGSCGLRGPFAAKDAETGESLPVAEGKIRVTLKKHDFRMVIAE